MKRMTLLATIVVGAQLAVVGSPARAQQYPNRVIEDSVRAAAGGGTDTVDRLIGKAMEKELGIAKIPPDPLGIPKP